MDSYKDKRIISIHKKNTGIGDTRNIGIEKYTGNYIMFIVIELDFVKTILNKVKA